MTKIQVGKMFDALDQIHFMLKDVVTEIRLLKRKAKK